MLCILDLIDFSRFVDIFILTPRDQVNVKVPGVVLIISPTTYTCVTTIYAKTHLRTHLNQNMG